MSKVGELITPTGRLVLPAGKLGSEDWLEYRRWRKDVPGGYCIGSSDVPSILNLDGVGTPAHVYRAKVMDIRPEPNEAMSWGHLNEPAIALEWCRRNHAVIDEIGLVSREGTPWHQSTIDRRVRECPVYRRDGVADECLLEVKNVDVHAASRWHAEIPDRIFAQVIHQLYVTGYGHAHWACLVGGNRLKQGIIYADREQKVTEYVVAAVEKFRTEHLIPEIEPPWDTAGKPDKMIELDEATYPDRAGVLDLAGIGEVQAYAMAAREAADAGTERKRQAALLRQLAAGHEFVKFADHLAYRVGPTTRTNVDLDKLQEKYPDVYADPEVVSETKSHTIYLAKEYKVSKPKKEE